MTTLTASNPIPVRSRSPAHRAMERFFRSRMVWLGSGLLIAIALACLVGWVYGSGELPAAESVMPSARYEAQDLSAALSPPSWRHPFGTDKLGRDVALLTFHGGSISLAIGLMAAVVSIVIGVTWGGLAGFIGGRVDEVMMRIVDVIFGLPYILLVMLLSVLFGSGHKVLVLFLAIGAVSWLTMARVVRGQVLSLRSNDYVLAAVAAGARPTRVLLVHVLPNLLGPVIVYATLIIPQAILQESFLSFLGIGVSAPQVSWGSLAGDGINMLNPVSSPWWLTLFPCLALALTLLSLNLIGDGLRDAFDPQLRRRK